MSQFAKECINCSGIILRASFNANFHFSYQSILQPSDFYKLIADEAVEPLTSNWDHHKTRRLNVQLTQIKTPHNRELCSIKINNF